MIDEKDVAAIQEPLLSGWLVQGPRVAEFEAAVAGYCAVEYAIAATSCTTALHLSLVAAGVGPGDEVIVPAFTYVATANAVEHTGARPIFIDIDPLTYNISIEYLRKYLAQCEAMGNQLPKAIIPVHLFGLCADMPNLMQTCRNYSMAIIEDAACALGAGVYGKAPGAFGVAACFSFHPRKVITTGEGGMIITNDENLARQLRILRDHGAEVSDLSRHKTGMGELPEFNTLGFNYRMTDFQGALGVSQMEKLPQILSARRLLAERYAQLLEEVAWLKTPICPEGFSHTYQSYVCQLDVSGYGHIEIGRIRSELMQFMDNKGISCRPGTHAVHLLGYYQKKYGLRAEDYPNACLAHNNTLTLPLFPGMTEEQQQSVVDAIRQFEP